MDNVICTSFKTILKRTKTKLNRIYQVDKKRRLTTTIIERRENDRRNHHQFNKTKRRTDKQMAAVSGATVDIIELKKKENGKSMFGVLFLSQMHHRSIDLSN